jgi:hypothetical protein
MISSEVQRTLVKSPPELWTELSDPDALARHLGELGDIKITRTEPETLIEWQAEGTTGRVAMKPSGWGTKVTLSVSRELPADAVPVAVTAEIEPEPPEPASEVQAEPPVTASEVQAEPPEAEVAAERDADPSEVESAETGGRSEATVELKPAPATEAARRAAGWPSLPPAPAPAIESELRAAEDAAPGPDDPAPLPEWPAARSEQPEDPAPEPRPGFFARLFGRRRRAPVEPSAPPELFLEDEPIGEPETPASGALDSQPLPVTLVGESPGTGEEEQDELEARESEHEPTTELQARESEHEPATEVQARESEHEPTTEVQARESEHEPATELQARESEHEPATELQAGETEQPAAAEPDAGLAAELKAAEEVAAEQVTAVLTGVLDRLGAAHHRPFSRA